MHNEPSEFNFARPATLLPTGESYQPHDTPCNDPHENFLQIRRNDLWDALEQRRAKMVNGGSTMAQKAETTNARKSQIPNRQS
jgi:hypothetical protein